MTFDETDGCEICGFRECNCVLSKEDDLRAQIEVLRTDLKWAFGEMNLAYFQKGDEQQAMVEKYADIIQELMNE